MAEKTNYYIDISLFSEGYAKFEINVKNYGNLGGIVIELPTLKCEDNLNNISDLRKKISVSDIPDEQTHEGLINLKPKCMGIMIAKPSDNSKNFTISFTYKNYDWEIHPENYPFDDYKMPILISFPEVRTEDSVLVSTRIFLPPNTEVENISAHRSWEHPANTQSYLENISYTIDPGNQPIILLESHSYLTKNNPAQAIFIPLEFERNKYSQILYIAITVLLFFVIILITVLVSKDNKNTDLGILTIVALVFSLYQFSVGDKPVGFTTFLDWGFLSFFILSLLLFIYYLLIKLLGLRGIIEYLLKKSKQLIENIHMLIKIPK